MKFELADQPLRMMYGELRDLEAPLSESDFKAFGHKYEVLAQVFNAFSHLAEALNDPEQEKHTINHQIGHIQKHYRLAAVRRLDFCSDKLTDEFIENFEFYKSNIMSLPEEQRKEKIPADIYESITEESISKILDKFEMDMGKLDKFRQDIVLEDEDAFWRDDGVYEIGLDAFFDLRELSKKIFDVGKNFQNR